MEAVVQKFEKVKSNPIKALFSENENRFTEYSIRFEDILFDYSKNAVNAETLELLIRLAKDCRLEDAANAMFEAEKINGTESRAVLHTALRNFSGKKIITDGNDIMPAIKKVQEQMKEFCRNVHKVTGKAIPEKRSGTS